MSCDLPQLRDEADYAIRVDSLSKHYLIFEKPEDRIKQMIVPRLQRLLGVKPDCFYRDFAALSDVSFAIRRGETVGIVGRNGAGKSSLLQCICGILAPSSGKVEVNGRVAALLELGAGFNPEFTGRENVFLNAAILGLSHKETETRIESIAAFADIGDFIDMPVKTYSSGMYVRLAFAVQAQIDPDILIVDEALAVGDARFQAKYFSRLKELRERGTSILLVTHSTEQVVAHCDRAILLEGGRVADEGEPRQVVNRYLDLLYGRPMQSESVKTRNESSSLSVAPAQFFAKLAEVDPDFTTRVEAFFALRAAYNPHEYRWGDRRAEIMDFFLFADNHAFPSVIVSGSNLVVYVRYRLSEEIVRPICGFTLKTKEGITVYGTNTEIGDVSGQIPAGEAGQSFIVCFDARLSCGAGDYFLSIGLASREINGEVIPHDRRYDAIHLHVTQQSDFFGLNDLQASLTVYADA